MHAGRFEEDMKTRTLTSAAYVLVVAALCACKWLIPGGYGSLLFDALFCAVAAIGAFELLRAFGCVSVLQRAVTITFCALAAPMYALFAWGADGSGAAGAGAALVTGALALCVLLVADHRHSDVKSTLACLFALAYAGLLSAVLSAVNHLPDEGNSMLAVMFLFMCVPFTDAGAYLVGIALGRVRLRAADSCHAHNGRGRFGRGSVRRPVRKRDKARVRHKGYGQAAARARRRARPLRRHAVCGRRRFAGICFYGIE